MEFEYRISPFMFFMLLFSYISSCYGNSICHSRGSGNPAFSLWIPAFAGYMFSQSLAFATIPKAYGFEAATHFPLTLLGGSLIPIVVYLRWR